MSNLPHPLGDSVAGDLFYPGSPSVTVADVAGAAGSRAVEFGEDGTSLAVNRGLYALGKNDEYIQDRMERPVARMEFTAWTPSGGSGGSFTFTGQTLFVGDASYLPESQSIRDRLISVLDGSFNELLDATTGHKVVLKSLRNTPDTFSIVGDTSAAGGDENGFYPAPIARFQLVNSMTGAVELATYIIPDGVSVVFAHAISGTLDSLGTLGSEYLMRDAWVKGSIRNAHEIHAGTFLKDGSRAAQGSFDLAGNNVNNVADITNSTGVPLDVISDNALTLKDQHLSAGVSLSESGETSLAGDLSSLVGELNSKTRGAVAAYGNRFRNRTGSVTFTGATGAVAWPTLDFIRDGEAFTLASGNLTATATTNEFVVIDSSNTVIKRAAASLQIGDIPVAYYYWDGATTFTISTDIRWAMDAKTGAMEITVGDTPGCDFPANAMQQAVDLASYVGSVSATADVPGSVVIRVVDSATWSTVLNITSPIIVRGEGVARTILTSSCGATSHGVNCNSNRVTFEDLSLVNASGALTGSFGGFYNAGDSSVFRNLTVQSYGTAWVWDVLTVGVLIEKCFGTGLTHSFILGASASLHTPYLADSVIRDCAADSFVSGANNGIVATGEGNKIFNCDLYGGAGNTLDNFGITIGGACVVSGCTIQMGGAGGNGVGLYYYPATGTPSRSQLSVVENCSFSAMLVGVWSDTNSAGTKWMLDVKNCTFQDVDVPVDLTSLDTFIGPESSFRFVDNYTSGSVASIMNLSLAGSTLLTAWIERNKFDDVTGDGIVMNAYAGGHITGNIFEGYGSAGTYSAAIEAAVSVGSLVIRDNYIGNVGAPAASTQVRLWRKSIVSGNTLIGSSAAATGVAVRSWFLLGIDLPAALECDISGNNFSSHATACILVDPGTGSTANNGSRIRGNHFLAVPSGGDAVKVYQSSSVMILDNEFGLMEGTAVLVDGTGAGYGDATTIRGNTFNLVEGDGSNQGFIVIIKGATAACQNCSVDGNTFNGCGSTDDAVIGTSYQAVIFVSATATGTQVQNNSINGLTGTSTSTNNSDSSYGIYVLAAGCLVANNKVYKDFAVATTNADTVIGIFVNGIDCQVVGNHVTFTGTQGGANQSGTIYGIQCTSTGSLINGNMVRGSWVVSGSPTSAGMNVIGDDCAITGNIVSGSLASDHSLLCSGTGGVVIGNVGGGSAKINWGTTGTNLPSLATYQDMNVSALGHA
jgi:hypothetical protein